MIEFIMAVSVFVMFAVIFRLGSMHQQSLTDAETDAKVEKFNAATGRTPDGDEPTLADPGKHQPK